ncbi:hypothetical protein HYU15_02685 [Candidatus Woesearchaeota archaeon]|nr:hypothetical protein [Candidatus Woesearchaeota archaeon]
MKSDIFYVGIENHVSVRRGILEASKELVHFLQRYEKLKALRSEKHAQASKLRAIYDDIVGMMADIKAELPKVDVRSLPKWHQSAKTIAPKTAAKAAAKPKAPVRHAVDRLEAELGEIEKKLKTIS